MNPKLAKINDRLIAIRDDVQDRLLANTLTEKWLKSQGVKCAKCQHRLYDMESGLAQSTLVDPCQSYADALAIAQAEQDLLASQLLAKQLQVMILQMLLMQCQMGT